MKKLLGMIPVLFILVAVSGCIRPLGYAVPLPSEEDKLDTRPRCEGEWKKKDGRWVCAAVSREPVTYRPQMRGPYGPPYPPALYPLPGYGPYWQPGVRVWFNIH